MTLTPSRIIVVMGVASTAPAYSLAATLVFVVAAVGLKAALSRPRPPEEPDVVYGEAGGQTLRLDIYRPTAALPSGAEVLGPLELLDTRPGEDEHRQRALVRTRAIRPVHRSRW